MAKNGDANWALLGESFIAVVKRPVRPAPMVFPPSMRRVPGPTLVVAERFADSPVGPFLSLSVGQPVRLGARPAYHFGHSVVSSKEARRLGRLFWGFPHEFGTLSWDTDGAMREMWWEEGDVRLTSVASARAFPFLAPMRSVQSRGDGPVVIPAWARATARRCRVTIESSHDGPLAMLNGTYGGLALSGMVTHRRPARRPHGLMSTLRAPLHSPEPGIAGMQTPARRVKVLS